ncbi:MAG: hypothetical protein M3283_07565 [Actinomycetota bacterium]|nr:hypothetical protein [Actinomycetota bacterium]
MTLDAGAFAQWQAQTLSFFTNLLGSEHVYLESFTTGVRKTAPSHVRWDRADIRTLISAEVFTDFLEMAGHLDDNGYKDPTAYPTGAVLEDVCEKLRMPIASCSKRGKT